MHRQRPLDAFPRSIIFSRPFKGKSICPISFNGMNSKFFGAVADFFSPHFLSSRSYYSLPALSSSALLFVLSTPYLLSFPALSPLVRGTYLEWDYLSSPSILIENSLNPLIPKTHSSPSFLEKRLRPYFFRKSLHPLIFFEKSLRSLSMVPARVPISLTRPLVF